MKIGLYFGSFNPVHIGHVILANHMLEFTDLDEVWMVVSPHNPHKKKASLLEDYHRLEMVYKAVSKYDNIKPSDIEFKLSQPSYTVNTLAYIAEKHPDNEFSLIMGQDNLVSFKKWKNHEHILESNDIYVYPRMTSKQVPNDLLAHNSIHIIDAPIIDISSTLIRDMIVCEKEIRPLLDAEVYNYIDSMNFYKK
ncbi:MAG: nicotinate-nucleotide adenylyltransferase [Flavobacteriaceae bacterium]|nr:nicotinate-nucleotide adenylyltransferase [Flavobacteriaceae bacterium]